MLKHLSSVVYVETSLHDLCVYASHVYTISSCVCKLVQQPCIIVSATLEQQCPTVDAALALLQAYAVNTQ